MHHSNFVNGFNINDRLVQRIVNDIYGSMSKNQYIELLVELGMYSYDTLHSEEYYGNTKRDLILMTIKEICEDDGLKLLGALKRRSTLSGETINALSIHGIDIDHSLAGELAKPAEEQNFLELRLSDTEFNTTLHHLKQSYETFVEGKYESSNAMIRSALEMLIETIAKTINQRKGDGPIPKRGRHYAPIDYREYLKATHYLDPAEKELVDRLYNYCSIDGSHPGIANEVEARLRRFMVIGMSLLLIDKYDNSQFMGGICK